MLSEGRQKNTEKLNSLGPQNLESGGPRPLTYPWICAYCHPIVTFIVSLHNAHITNNTQVIDGCHINGLLILRVSCP